MLAANELLEISVLLQRQSSQIDARARAVADKARMSRQKNTTDLDNTACAAVSGGAAALKHTGAQRSLRI